MTSAFEPKPHPSLLLSFLDVCRESGIISPSAGLSMRFPEPQGEGDLSSLLSSFIGLIAVPDVAPGIERREALPRDGEAACMD
jgi:hypothetical protein